MSQQQQPSLSSYTPYYPKPHATEQSATPWGDWATQYHPDSNEYAEAIKSIESIRVRNNAQYAVSNPWPVAPTIIHYPRNNTMQIPQHQAHGLRYGWP